MTIFPLGAYLGNPNGSSAAGESQFEADYEDFSNVMGAQPRFLDLYVDQMKPVSDWVENAGWQAWSASLSPVARSPTPVIGFPMASGASGSPTPDQFYRNFASGQYDSVIAGVIQQYAQMGFTVQYLRPGWEFNLNEQPHYAGDDPVTQADWVKAFQHIANVMHAAGAASGVTVKVIWNPSITNYTNAQATTNLYPGDSYVDVIAADVYSDLHPYADGPNGLIYDWDKSGQVLDSPKPIFSTLQQWASSAINIEHYYEYPASGRWALDQSGGHALTLETLIEFAKAHGKMFAVAETGAGATSDGAGVADNAIFVKWLNQTLLNSAAQVAFVNVWDSNGGSNYAFSAANDGKPNEAAAWNIYFGSGSDLDTTPPAVTLALSSDPSASASYIITSHANLVGGGDANATVTVRNGNLVLGTTVADAQGHWSFTPTNLIDGSYSLTASEIDAAGNTGSTTLDFILDTSAPAVIAPVSVTPVATPVVIAPVMVTPVVITPTTTPVSPSVAASVITPVAITPVTPNFMPSQPAADPTTLIAPAAPTVPTMLPATSAADVGTTYRFFDSVHGTQFLTSSASERDSLVATRPDLSYEGKGLATVAADPSNANVVSVFRFFSKLDGTHFFTTDVGERDGTLALRSDLTYEGAGFYEHLAQQTGDVAVYRFFNATNGSHFFTSSDSERVTLSANRPDMVQEGIAFYSPKI